MQSDMQVSPDEDMSSNDSEKVSYEGKEKVSLRKAINNYCKECIHDPLSGMGQWRQQVEACTIVKCPLYKARPRSKANKEGE